MKLDDEALLRTYPMTVAYPEGGERVLLCWRTQGGGSRVVIARREEQIPPIVRQLKLTQMDLALGDYFRARVVAPPRDECLGQARERHESRIEGFWSNVGFNFMHLREGSWVIRSKDLPPGLQVCKQWEPKEGWEDEPRRRVSPDHWGCRHCYRRIRPSEGTLESVYLEKQALYESLYPKETKCWNLTTTSRVSRAEPAMDGEPVWAFLGEFGHHQAGAIPSKEPGYHPSGDVRLFFYTDPRTLDRSRFDQMVTDDKEAFHREQVKRRKEREAEARREKEEERNRVFLLFPRA